MKCISSEPFCFSYCRKKVKLFRYPWTGNFSSTMTKMTSFNCFLQCMTKKIHTQAIYRSIAPFLSELNLTTPVTTLIALKADFESPVKIHYYLIISSFGEKKKKMKKFTRIPNKSTTEI